MQPKKVSRRSFLGAGTAAAAVAGLAIGGIAGYEIGSNTNSSPAQTSSSTTVSTSTGPTVPLAEVWSVKNALSQLGPVTSGMISGTPDSGVISVNLPEFISQTGIQVNLEALDSATVQQKIQADLTAQTGHYDQIELLGRFAVLWNQQVIDVNPLMAELDPSYASDYFPGVIAYNTYNGKLVGLPFKFSGTVLGKRPSLMTAAGVSDPKSFDDLSNAMAKLTDSANQIYGFAVEPNGLNCSLGLAQREYSQFDPASGQPHIWVDKTGNLTYNAQWAIDEVTWEYGLFKNGVLPPQTPSMGQYDSNNLWLAGGVAFQGLDATAVQDPKQSKIINDWGAFDAVIGPHNFQWGLSSGQGLGIPIYSQKQEGAWMLIKYVCGIEGTANELRYQTSAVSRKSSYALPQYPQTVAPHLLDALNGHDGAGPQGLFITRLPGDSKLNNYAIQMLGDVYSGNKSPTQALSDAQTAAVAAGVTQHG